MRKLNRELAKISAENFINKNEMGSADNDRLRNLVADLNESGEITFKKAIEILYPDTVPAKALDNIRAFRRRIREAAEEAKSSFELVPDQQKKADTNRRHLWFEAGPALFNEVYNTLPKSKNYLLEQYIENIAVEESSEPDEVKIPIKVFVSYSRQDDGLRYTLVEELKKNAKHEKYAIEFWQDKNIVLGKDWMNSILDALKSCDYGLLMITPDFLNSNLIKEHEIPALIKKGIIPVGLRKMEMEDLEKFGIHRNQVFFYGDCNKHYFFEETADDTRPAYLYQPRKECNCCNR